MINGNDHFKKFVLISIGLHVLIFVAIKVKITFFPRDISELTTAVRVDVVALPDKVEPNKKIVEKKPEPKPVAKKPKPKPKKPKPKPKPKKPKFVEKKKPKPKDQRKIKQAKSEQEKALEDLRKRMAEKEKEKQETQEYVFAGNVKSDGTGLAGMEKIKFSRYLGELEQHIKNNWILPQWMADDSLNATITLKIQENGQVKDRSFDLRSGNEEFDNYVEEAINKSAPLPPPPKELVSMLLNVGIQVGFP